MKSANAISEIFPSQFKLLITLLTSLTSYSFCIHFHEYVERMKAHLSISPSPPVCSFFYTYTYARERPFSFAFQNHDKYRGKTFQLAGPAEYSYKEVVEFVHDLTNKSVPIVDIPIFLAKAAGTVNNTWIRPFITEDVVNQMQEDCIELQGTDMLTMKDLGIEPVSMDKMAFSYLHRFRPGGHFVKVQGYYLEGQGQSDAKSHRQGENM